MKRILASLILMSSLLVTAVAQESFIDHLAVGVNIGTTSMRGRVLMSYFPLGRQTDGVGLELAAQFTDWLDARVGFSMNMPGSGSGAYGIEGIVDGRFIADRIQIGHEYGLLAGSLLFDFYPFRNTTFHFTAGVYAGNNKLLRVYNTTPVPEILEVYDKGVVEIHGVAIPVDKDGEINAEVRIPAVRPYLGVGIGRAFSRRVNVAADLGVIYKGREGMTICAPDGSRVEVGYWDSNNYMSRMTQWNRKCIVAPLLSVRMFVTIF